MVLTPAKNHRLFAIALQLSAFGMGLIGVAFMITFPGFDIQPLFQGVAFLLIAGEILKSGALSIRQDQLETETYHLNNRQELNREAIHHLNLCKRENDGIHEEIFDRLERIEEELGIEEPTQEKKGLNALFDDVDLEEESKDD